jgi:hypothetical protein
MSKFALSNFFLFFIFLFFFSPPPPLSLSSYPFIPIGSPSLITGAPESRCRSATRPPHLRPAAPGPGLLLPALPRPTPPPPAPLPHLLLLCGEPWVCLSCSAQPEGNGGKRGRSRMEPRKCGPASPSEAARGSGTSSTPGASVIFTVWEGSAWSRSWSRSQSPHKP